VSFQGVISPLSRGSTNSSAFGVKMSYAVAKFAYEPQREDELRLSKGDHLHVLDKSSDGWWRGEVNIFFG